MTQVSLGRILFSASSNRPSMPIRSMSIRPAPTALSSTGSAIRPIVRFRWSKDRKGCLSRKSLQTLSNCGELFRQGNGGIQVPLSGYEVGLQTNPIRVLEEEGIISWGPRAFFGRVDDLGLHLLQ